MKRRYSLVFLLAMILFCAIGSGKEAQAKSEYEVYGPDITSFHKSGKKLTVKAVKQWHKGIMLNGKETSLKKISFKLSKNCKWSTSVAGTRKYQKSSYKKTRKQVISERSKFKKDGEYASGSVVVITVKNKKIVRVNIYYS